jgi:Nif-specific regulatory protein
VSATHLTTDQVLAVGQKLLELRPVAEVLDAVLSAAMNSVHAETGLVLLRDEKGKLNVAAEKHRSEPRGLDSISSSLLDEAFARREPVLTENAVSDPRFSGKSSIILQRIQAAVILPLVSRERIIGAIYLDSRSDRSQFTRLNLDPLATLATFSTLAIENARRYEEAKHAGSEGKGTTLVGSSPAMQELFSLIERLSSSDLPVIVTGESGTGKELVAREIHQQSTRKDKPFLALYCGNVAPQLFESELFGHKKGSFTGATADKQGLVEAAAGGTLFLDEVADIPADLQTKLLRFLQEGEYRAVGATKTKKADVRIIAATNRDLQREVAANHFRSDLYYRLYVLPVHTPPLRDRLSDLPFLVRHFLEKYGDSNRQIGVSPEALRRLMSCSWQGNVRELENTIARALVVARGERIEPEDIMLTETEADVNPSDLTWKSAERNHILQVLSICGGNKSRAAEMLGISRRYLHYKLKEWEEHQ